MVWYFLSVATYLSYLNPFLWVKHKCLSSLVCKVRRNIWCKITSLAKFYKSKLLRTRMQYFYKTNVTHAIRSQAAGNVACSLAWTNVSVRSRCSLKLEYAIRRPKMKHCIKPENSAVYHCRNFGMLPGKE